MNRTLPLVALLLACGPLAAQNGGIDRRFGDDGIASIGDPQDLDAPAIGIATCATSAGSALLVSELSGPPGLATLRITVDGRPASALTRIALPAAQRATIAACAADGRIVVARTVLGAGTDTDVQVVRLRTDGSLDPTFGQGTGAVTVDLDDHAVLGDLERAMSINVEPDGGVLVGLRLDVPGGDSDAGLLRLAPDGALRFARHYPSLPGISGTFAATAAGLAPDGRVWMVGSSQEPGVNRWFRASLDAPTGEGIEVLAGAPTPFTFTGGGRVLPDGTLVFAARATSDGLRYLPRLVVLRGNEVSEIDLPAPFDVAGAPGSMHGYLGHGSVIPTGTSGLLYVSPLTRSPDVLDEVATYVAMVQLGENAAQDRVDPRFGIAGRSQFAWRGSEVCAGDAPPRQRPVHATNWRGRPLLTGWHTTTCAGTSPRAMLARILDGEDVFAHDFE